jgi:hypothetical protein
MPFWKGIFGKKKKPEPATPAFDDPLDLVVGDQIVYYQQVFTVGGVAVLQGGYERRYQYRLEDESGAAAVLAAERDGDLVLSLQRPVDRACIDYEGGDTLVHEGERFELSHRGIAAVRGVGDVPRVWEMSYEEFEDAEDERVVVFERWGKVPEARAGESVDEGEISVIRQGKERYDPKALPRLDVHAVVEAAQSRQGTQAALSDAEKEKALAEAREKLARIKANEL